VSESRKKTGLPRGGKPPGLGKLGGSTKPPGLGAAGGGTRPSGLGKLPGLRSLVVQFKPDGDPTTKQTEAVRSILKRYPRKAAVKREFPGAIKIEVAPEVEDELRRSIDALEEWGVGSEGQAAMPDKPIPEE